MDLFNKELQELVAKGRTQGYLSYDEVNSYLPDEELDPYRLDNLLIALEEQGIELLNEAADAEPVIEPLPPPKAKTRTAWAWPAPQTARSAAAPPVRSRSPACPRAPARRT